jgi:hypothetical protein
MSIGLSSVFLMIGASLGRADPVQAPGVHADYATIRIEAAFLVVSEIPAENSGAAPAAVKGDLPPGCIGPFRPDVQAECIDAAYEPGSDVRTILESRVGSTSVLMRSDGFTGAALAAQGADYVAVGQ